MTTGILIVTHGGSGAAMLDAARTLVGDGAGDEFEALEIDAGDDREATRSRVAGAVARVAGGGGVVIAVDLHGSTPFNVAVELAQRPGANVAVVSGVNLPMLVKLATVDRGRTPSDIAHLALETGIKSIRVIP